MERYRRPKTEQENGKIGYGSEKRIIMKEILATAGKNEKQICFKVFSRGLKEEVRHCHFYRFPWSPQRICEVGAANRAH